MNSVADDIKRQIKENAVILYMKGSPESPRCGFSAQVVDALSACGKPFAFVDVLAEPAVRSTLPSIANWPTFPQLYIQGELIGGCDIVMQLHASGELKTLLDAVGPVNTVDE